jgi:hypothetical protein
MFAKRSECLNIFGTLIRGKSEVSEEMVQEIYIIVVVYNIPRA